VRGVSRILWSLRATTTLDSEKGTMVYPFCSSLTLKRICLATLFSFIGLLCALNAALMTIAHLRFEGGNRDLGTSIISSLRPQSHDSKINKLKEDEHFSFAACLIVKDDNQILPEWLAYHYTVMPLRHLIVAIDPLSITSPKPIFEKFRELGMDITVWDDRDFNINARVWYHKAATPGDPYTHKHEAYMFRQNEFYWECLMELSERKDRGEKLTWTMIIDTDEYVVFNNYLKSETEEANDPRAMMPKVGNRTIAEYILQQNQSNDSSIWNTFPCIVFPRMLIGSMESDSTQVSSQVPHGFDPLSFNTMRFRYYELPQHITAPGKSFVDVSRYHGTRVPNPHAVLALSCYAPNKILTENPAFADIFRSTLRIHHYIGHLDMFLRGNSSRGEETYNERNRLVSKEETDDSIRGWLQAFVNDVGERKAFEVTQELRLWAIENFAQVLAQKELGNFTYPFYKPSKAKQTT